MTRPDYKALHELAREALGDGYTYTAFRKWRKTLSASIFKSLGFTADGRPKPPTQAEKLAAQNAKRDRKAFGNDKRLFLISRRGNRVPELHECDECRVRRHVLRYSRSSIGVAYVCAACKAKVFGRSFGKVDAMSIAVQGGGFESKRRRF
jgi:hypothetical protein